MRVILPVYYGLLRMCKRFLFSSFGLPPEPAQILHHHTIRRRIGWSCGRGEILPDVGYDSILMVRHKNKIISAMIEVLKKSDMSNCII